MSIFNWNKKEIEADISKKTEAPKGQTEVPAVSAGGDYSDPQVDVLTAANISNFYITNSWVRKYVNTLVYGCLRYKLQAFPAPGVNGNKARKHVDEINALLTVANDTEVFSDVREKYLKDYFLYGNGAVEIQPRKGSDVKELFAAPGYLLRAKIDSRGNINPKQAYAFLDPNTGTEDTKIIYGIEDIIHFKLNQLSDRFYGTSPISSISKELSSDTKAIKEMERGDFGVVPQVLAFPKQTKGFIDKVMGCIQTVITGRGGNKIVSVNSDDIKKITLTDKTYQDEFDFQKWLVQRHNIYGIPPFKLGFVSETGSMSAREQREEFLTLIQTVVTYECEKLTHILCLKRLGYDDVIITAPELVTRVDFDKARVLDRLVQGGVITPNEARERYLGMSRIEDKFADQLVVKSMADIEDSKQLPAAELKEKRKKVLDALIKNNS